MTRYHYIVGDVHACLEPLHALLNTVQFDPAFDRLWLTGDLIGRGPQPLETLTFIEQLGDAANAVLGNHDLNAIAVAEGLAPRRPDDELDSLLQAPQGPKLLTWLRHRPLLLRLPKLPYTIIHAGMPPIWDLDETTRRAQQAENRLQGPDYRTALKVLYGNSPDTWSDTQTADEQLRFIVNALTRMRYCSRDGRLLLKAKGVPEMAPTDHYPWYAAPGNHLNPEQTTIVSGHWSTLGFREGPGYIALDTGCLWGGCLSLLRIDAKAPASPPQVIQHSCPQYQSVHD